MHSCKHLLFSLPLLLPTLACSTTLPDVAPFAEATVHLRSSISVAGDAVIEELDRSQVSSERVDQLRNAWERRNEIMEAMVVYADSLSAIVAAGEADAQAADQAVDSFSRFAQTVGYPYGPAAEAVTRLARSSARQIAMARRREQLEDALEDLQPAIEGLVVQLEDDLLGLDRKLLGTDGEVERALLNQPKFAGLHQHRDRLRRFLRAVDVEVATADEMQKAAHAAVLLRASEPLVAERDDKLARLRERVRAIRQLLAETRVCLRFWAMTHRNLVIAVRQNKQVEVGSVIGAARQIDELVKRIREM